MTIQTFTWRPKSDATGTVSFRVLTAQFGDGYKQEAPDGINTKSQSWPLAFTGSKDLIEAIVAFLDDHVGSRAFYWTPPLGNQILVKAKTYTSTPIGGSSYSLAVTFDQEFQP